MKKLAKYFLQGLLIFVPVVGSISVVVWVLALLDRLYALPVPGMGLVILLGLILLVGFLANNVAGAKAIEMVEAGMRRLPVVNLLYTSLRDLLGAFVGDKRTFTNPVMVTVAPETGIRVFGFVTCDRFDDARLAGHVAVYLPQSYNFAGNLLIVKKELVEPVDAESAQFMAFIVSGGVASMRAARTIFDEEQSIALMKRRR